MSDESRDAGLVERLPQQRERFEQWFKMNYPLFREDRDTTLKHRLWTAWQVAALSGEKKADNIHEETGKRLRGSADPMHVSTLPAQVSVPRAFVEQLRDCLGEYSKLPTDRWPGPPSTLLKELAAMLAASPAPAQVGMAMEPIAFVNGSASCGCILKFSDGHGEYSDVHRVTLCAHHNGRALLSKVIHTGWGDA